MVGVVGDVMVMDDDERDIRGSRGKGELMFSTSGEGVCLCVCICNIVDS